MNFERIRGQDFNNISQDGQERLEKRYSKWHSNRIKEEDDFSLA
jgi:hypothetical protein